MRPIKEVKIQVNFVKMANDFVELVKEASKVKRLQSIRTVCACLSFVVASLVAYFILCADFIEEGAGISDLLGALFICCIVGGACAFITYLIVECIINDTKQIQHLLECISEKYKIPDILGYVHKYERTYQGLKVVPSQSEALEFLCKMDFLGNIYDNWEVLRALQTSECLVYLTDDAKEIRILNKATGTYCSHSVGTLCSTMEGTEHWDLTLLVNDGGMVVVDRHALQSEMASVSSSED